MPGDMLLSDSMVPTAELVFIAAVALASIMDNMKGGVSVMYPKCSISNCRSKLASLTQPFKVACGMAG